MYCNCIKIVYILDTFILSPHKHMAKVKELFIKNIKNIEYVEMEADQTINYIAGNNGAGKTSLVESIFQAISLKEFAKSDDARKLIKK